MNAFDQTEWSTIILTPSFWDRLKFLFKRKPEIMFCWGQDEYTIRGIRGWSYWSVGGVPTEIRKEKERSK